MKLVLSIVSILALVQPGFVQSSWAQTVLDSDFTISVPRSPGQEAVVESTTLVPLLEGTCYNWHLRLGKTKGAVEITEVYTLPAKPKSWDLGDDSTVVVSKDKLSATSTLSLFPLGGWINNGWCVSAGDPVGDYSFEIKSGNTLLHRFEFELQEM